MVDLEKIQGTYLTDILEQPRALRDTVEALKPFEGLQTARDNLRGGRLHRIVLTGMGGSYQILHPLHLRLTAAGFDSIMVETSELLYAMPALLDVRHVVIVVSQSGASAETVRLMDREGPLYIAVSNTPSSPLVTRAHLSILTRAGEEGGVSCKTAVTSLAALHWVGEQLTQNDLGAARSILMSAASAAETYLADWQRHVETLAEQLANIQRVFFAGRGTSLAAAGLGAMVQKEAAHFHGEGMSSAALRHGPFEMLGPDSFVVVFEGDSHVQELNRGLARAVMSTGAACVLCGSGVSEGPFALPPSDDAARPILELLPTQMMSLALAYLGGREPGKFERITKITTLE